ncbi:hypothetical protein ILUMI_19224 [Ignelater luminosus]|uniref:DUF659 domain-containing protein n=1 Tax=Ignelater luminosus TaxID=2038154 RepID=A0A8K0G5N7_IGNLU|nr:hypothetical protein ILUMI_19224 [Ignelater luminosus]
MRGKHVELQKRVLNVNPRTMFVPCAAHFLNLVVNDAAKLSNETASEAYDNLEQIANDGNRNVNNKQVNIWPSV